MTGGIKDGLATLNPYRKTEAETMAFSEGMKARQNKANIEASAKDGAAGRRSVAPVSPVTAQSGSAANTSTGSPMLNYGSQGDDDAF